MTSTEFERAIKILVVDDHPPFAQGLAALIDQQSDMKAVGMAGNGDQALQFVRESKPEVVVMDVSMPGKTGIEVTKLIKKEFPDTIILILSAYANPPYLMMALEAGAAGYLTKSVPLKDLLDAIRSLKNGEVVLDPSLATKLLRNIVRTSWSSQGSQLDKNEIELLKLGAKSISNREIAAQLFLSERTVQSRFTAIFAKLGVASRMEAVLKAVKEGWLTIDDLP